jgi:4-amino-4-deoxy-L-arabinose transferase-like glycosyltransferase
MDYIKNLKNNHVYLLLVPVMLTFIIALIPTLKYQWPLSGDIFFHVHMAKLYMIQGFTYWDPLTAAPFGRPIFYPPIFHLLMLSLSFLFGDIFDVARFMQPVLGMLIVLSFSYVAFKLNNSLLVGISAGFFLFFSSVFKRILLPLPENLALIIFPLAFYGFYLAIERKNYDYASVAGILAGIIFLTHTLSAICLLIVTSIYSIIINLREKVSIRYLGIFLLLAAIIALIWWAPILIQYGIISNLQTRIELNLWNYPKFLGYITLIFAALGFILIIKRKNNADTLILTAFITLLGISLLNYVGLPVLSNRILTFAVFPLVIMAGMGVELLKTKFMERGISRKIFYSFLCLVYLASILSALAMVADYDKSPSWLRVSNNQLDIAEWFKSNGDGKTVVIAYNYGDPIIVAISGQPVALGGYGEGIPKSLNLEKYTMGKANRSDFIKDHVGYIVLPSEMKNPPYTRLVHKNADYAIYMFNN